MTRSQLHSLLWLTGLLAAPVCAAQEFDKATLAPSAQQWLHGQAQSVVSRSANPLRVLVQVGAPDARLRLAACDMVEYYQPLGALPWGNTRVGVRCTDGRARWNITLAAQVQAWGAAWVMQNPLPAGAVVQENDVLVEEVDWAAQTDAIVTERAQWLGYATARPLAAGQALRRSMVKPAQVFAIGSTVRVVAQGSGFAVSTDAQALSAGAIGQTVRVRLEGGRITSGIVIDGRTVRLDL